MLFDFTIEYKPGVENQAVDALSRCFQLPYSQPHGSLIQDFQKLQPEVHLSTVIKELQTNALTHFDFHWKQKLLWWHDQVAISNDETIKTKLLQEFFSSHLRGHGGQLRTYARLVLQIFWLGILQDVNKFI